MRFKAILSYQPGLHETYVRTKKKLLTNRELSVPEKDIEMVESREGGVGSWEGPSHGAKRTPYIHFWTPGGPWLQETWEQSS